MKNVLIIWGGWNGHKPQSLSDRIAIELDKKGYNHTVTSDFSCLINEDLKKYDVIIPIWSCGIKGDFYLSMLLEAVKNGVGLLTFHGGINWFEDEKYYDLIGGFYIKDTQPETYLIRVNNNHPITSGMIDYEISSEKYDLMTSPHNEVLAYADFSGINMPIAWVKNYGKGRIFYSALAHDEEQFFRDSNLKMILNAIDWVACKNE